MTTLRYKYVSIGTLIAFFLITAETALAHESENHVHAQGSTSSTRVEINTNTGDSNDSTSGKSELRIRIENRLNSQKQIQERKQIEINQRKASLEEKLAEISDTRKRNIAERLSTQMNKINDVRTERYLHLLARLERILGKIENRINRLKDVGVNVDALAADVAAIKSAIESTIAKVEAQQDKTYTVEIQSAETLGQDFTKVHNQLKNDLTALHNEIKSIKDDISELFKDLRAVKPTPTPTTTTSPETN